MPAPPHPAFEEKLCRALRLYPPDGRALVGVSGGRDSVALLHGLLAADYRRLIVCHLDHGLRGEAGTGDAEFVRRLAEELRLPVEIGRVEVRRSAQEQKLSLEAAAREARYQFFAEVAAREGVHDVYLGHHADDQAETFLFNLLRGAGSAGLGAMAAESERIVAGHSLRLLRPLLAVWREEIDAYVQTRGLEWREDATNADPSASTRNCLRHEVLPLLARAMGREVKPALWRAADLLGTQQAWLDARDAGQPAWPEKLPVKMLLAQPLAERRRTVRRWLRDREVGGVGYREVEAVLSLLEIDAGPAKVNLPGDRHVRRKEGLIFVELPAAH